MVTESGGGILIKNAEALEGFEKVAHRLLHPKDERQNDHAQRLQAVADSDVDMVEFEKNRIRGAIRTDAILSAEIIVIALGTVQDASLGVQFGVLALIAAGVTIGVYGLVAGIVKYAGPRLEASLLKYIERIGWAVVVLSALVIAYLMARG